MYHIAKVSVQPIYRDTIQSPNLEPLKNTVDRFQPQLYVGCMKIC